MKRLTSSLYRRMWCGVVWCGVVVVWCCVCLCASLQPRSLTHTLPHKSPLSVTTTTTTGEVFDRFDIMAQPEYREFSMATSELQRVRKCAKVKTVHRHHHDNHHHNNNNNSPEVTTMTTTNSQTSINTHCHTLLSTHTRAHTRTHTHTHTHTYIQHLHKHNTPYTILMHAHTHNTHTYTNIHTQVDISALSRDEALAFWINIYNMLVIHAQVLLVVVWWW